MRLAATLLLGTACATGAASQVCAFEYGFYITDDVSQTINMNLADFQALTGVGSNVAPPSSAMVENSVDQIVEDDPSVFGPLDGELFDVYLYAGAGIKKYDVEDLLITLGFEHDTPYGFEALTVYQVGLNNPDPYGDIASLPSTVFHEADFVPANADVAVAEGYPDGASANFPEQNTPGAGSGTDVNFNETMIAGFILDYRPDLYEPVNNIQYADDGQTPSLLAHLIVQAVGDECFTVRMDVWGLKKLVDQTPPPVPYLIVGGGANSASGDIQICPEPASLAVWGALAAGGLLVSRRRRRRRGARIAGQEGAA